MIGRTSSPVTLQLRPMGAGFEDKKVTYAALGRKTERSPTQFRVALELLILQLGKTVRGQKYEDTYDLYASI